MSMQLLWVLGHPQNGSREGYLALIGEAGRNRMVGKRVNWKVYGHKTGVLG